MKLAKICVAYPVLMVVLNLVFIFLGVVSFSTVGIDADGGSFLPRTL